MERKTEFKRQTKETHVWGEINLHGSGVAKIETGIGFLDHMLELFTFHSGIDLTLTCKGDLEVCVHHSVEDIALTLGESIHKVLQGAVGIRRYATCFLPMDETLTRTVVDVSGRPFYLLHGKFEYEKIGELPTEMISHFFKSLCVAGKITLHQEIIYGGNDHHRAESLFKGFARALSEAVQLTGSNQVPSTKGVL